MIIDWSTILSNILGSSLLLEKSKYLHYKNSHSTYLFFQSTKSTSVLVLCHNQNKITRWILQSAISTSLGNYEKIPWNKFFSEIWNWRSITTFLKWSYIENFFIIQYSIMLCISITKNLDFLKMICIWYELSSCFLQKFMVIWDFYKKIWKFYNKY